MAQKNAQLPYKTFEFSDDDLLENQESDVELEDVVAEIEHTYNESEHYETAPCNETAKTEDEAYSALERALDKLEEKPKFCTSCSTQSRVTKVSSLEKGQHISMPGKHLTKYVKAQRKLVKLYDHHAIIKEIKRKNGSSVTMVLIHFTYIEGNIGVYEETKDFDLSETELYIVKYVSRRYSADEIIARAESVCKLPKSEQSVHKAESQSGQQKSDKFKRYNPLIGNCEHFATWCVAGDSECFQIQSLRKKIANSLTVLFGAGSKITKGILRLLFISSDEIARGFSRVLPECVLGGAAAVYLLYCIVITTLHVKDYFKGQMCKSCLKGKLLDLWLTFGAFGLTSVITFLIMNFAMPLLAPGVGIPLTILLILLSVAFQMSVPRLRKAFSSPFATVNRVKVTNVEQICIGDILSHRYIGFKHIGIVTHLDVKGQKQKGKIRMVHYGLPGLFKKRKIVEDDFKVDTKKSSLYLLDCRTLSTFPADVVVSRARNRVGETKWDMFSNRSDHFSYWAKVQQYDDFDDISYKDDRLALPKTQASLFIEKRDIHRMDELRIGDVVKSDVIGKIDDTGILSVIRNLDNRNERKFEIEVITYSFLRKVSGQKYQIDLDKDTLYVKKYNPAQCQPMEQRAVNARNMKDKTGSWMTTEGFIEYCIEHKSH